MTGRSLQSSRSVWWVGLGMAGGLFIRIIGYLSLLEVWLLMTVPLRLREISTVATSRGVLPFTLLWMGWMLGALVADISNATPPSLAARGFSRAFFVGFVCLSLLPRWRDMPGRLESFLVGVPIAQVIGLKYLRSGTYTNSLGEIDSTELGWANWTNYFLAAVVTAFIARLWRTSPWACTAIAAASGVINLLLGSRSAGATQLLAAGLLPFFMGRWTVTRGLGALRLGGLVVAAILASFMISVLYGQLAAGEHLGEAAREKYRRQQSAPGGLLVGGRTEFFVGLTAALDRPIIGHGSWPEDKEDYVAKTAARFGLEIDDSRRRRDPHTRAIIPTHSAIVGAWVDHGIMGAVFWIAIARLVVVSTPRVVRYLPDLTGLIVFNAPAALWAILFSPIQQRAANAIVIVPLLIIQMRHWQARHLRARRQTHHP